MAIIKCKMCGGDLNLIEGASTAECEFCGSVQTIPNLDDEKKLIQFERAERLRKQCEFDKAAGIYETIVADFRQEAEAYWGLVLCKYGIEYVDDPATCKKIPTCHRSSFDSIMEDSDFEQALENADGTARKVYREEAKQIEEIRKGIISVSSNEQPYDIFICYKETDEKGERTLDSVLAQDVYDALTDKGYRVFFSRITLEDKLGQEYEPYIFAALNSAKVMLAFGTDYEYFNAVWVKNEWSRFLKLMAKDKQKHLIPCYKGIDAYDMPKEFAKLQAQDLGKVGAVQDLLRGIEKLLPRQRETAVATQQMFAVQQASAINNPTIESYLERAFICLEDGDWADAKKCCDQVLNIDPKNAKAYLGMLLADLNATTLEELKNSEASFEDNSNYKKLLRFGDEETKEMLMQLVKQQEVLRLEKLAAEKRKQEHLAKIKNYEQNHQAEFKEFRASAKIVDGKLILYKGRQTQICIPPDITAIGDRAFRFGYDITAITIPDSVTSIGEGAFDSCSSLTSITIPDSVTSIGEGAFSWCKSLTSITLPDSVTSIGEDAFRWCESLTSITIPDSVTSIGEYAFFDCKALTSITIPDGVTSIGKEAFSGCESLTSITIPDSVTNIEKAAFACCDSLKQINISSENKNFRMINGCLIDVKAGMIVFGSADAQIPDNCNIVRIGNAAFQGCTSVTALTIPDGVTSIGEYAFDSCSSLTSITIPDSVTNIEKAAFSDCNSLEKINITSGNKNYRMISGCLIDINTRTVVFVSKNAVIPDDGSVIRIGACAFSDRETRTSITIPDSVTSIGEEAFSGCESLTSITIPDSVTSIGEGAFRWCESLTSITIPDSVTSIGEDAFSWCESLTSITIPDSVTSIGKEAFSGCKSLTSITIPDSVTDIADDLFGRSEPDVTIYASKNSHAAKWAEEHRVSWVDREEAERIAQQKREEAERIAQHEREEQQKKIWRLHMQCQHCGGELKGFFSKKCVSCGKPKDY